MTALELIEIVDSVALICILAIMVGSTFKLSMDGARFMRRAREKAAKLRRIRVRKPWE